MCVQRLSGSDNIKFDIDIDRSNINIMIKIGRFMEGLLGDC